MTNDPQIQIYFQPSPVLRSTRELAFEAFHRANPEILGELTRIAQDLKRVGFRQIGIAFIFERLRWLYSIETKTDDGFKLNNNHRAYYARLIMATAPDLAGFFRLREQEIEYEPDLRELRL